MTAQKEAPPPPPQPLPKRRTAKWNERESIIRDIIIIKATNSPTRIARILRDDFDIKITQQSVSKYVQAIRDERRIWRDGLARDVYETTIWDEHEQLNKEIKTMEAALPGCKVGAQMAMLAQALDAKRARREYVMSKLALLPRLVEIEYAKLGRHEGAVSRPRGLAAGPPADAGHP